MIDKRIKKNMKKLGFLLFSLLLVGLVNWLALLPFIFGYLIAMYQWGEDYRKESLRGR